MKFFIFMLFSLVGPQTFADQLTIQRAESLSQAKLVVIGRVESSSYSEKSYKGQMRVRVLDVIKGSINSKTVEVSVDKNPLSGHDILLEKGDTGVFFFKDFSNGKASFFIPGSVATFPRDHFE